MAATELQSGAALGQRYHLEHLLGTGGMASVWLAHDTRLHRQVALKVLSDTLALDQDYRIRFEREARLAAGLSHPNLVRVFDFSGQDTRPYLVMEYIPGGTLADRLRTGASAGLDVAELMRDLLGAVSYIHAAGIVHRDIKPANVLMGGEGRPRLTDFGVARPAAETTITRPGLVIGTARYIAPEVMAGAPADERADLYACGILLQDCLGDAGAPQLRTLAERLSAPAPEARPPSAAGALALLDDDLTAPTQIRVHRTRSPLPVLAAGLALAAILLVVLVVALSSGGGNHATSRAGPSAPPSAQAPLGRQLDYLDRAIGAARR